MKVLKVILGIAWFIIWVLGARIMILYGSLVTSYLSPFWLFIPLLIIAVKRKYEGGSAIGRFGISVGIAIVWSFVLTLPTFIAFGSLNDSLTEYAVSRFINQVAEQDGISDGYCYRDKDITTTIITDFTSDFEVNVVDYQFEAHILLATFENGIMYDFYASYRRGCWHMAFR